MFRHGGRALNGLGAPQGYRTQSNSEYYDAKRGSETADAKTRSRKGNSPDPQLRSPRLTKCLRMLSFTDNQEVGLEAAIPLKSA